MKAKHPSKEELQKKMMEKAAEAEKIKKEEENNPPEDPKNPEKQETPPETPETPPETPETPPKAPEKPETPPKKPEDKPETPPETPPGFVPESRYINSTAEAQVLAAQNKRLSEAIEKADSLPEPTDEEMKAEHSDWDDLTPFEQRMARGQIHNAKKMKIIGEAGKEGKKFSEWSDKVDEFLGDPKALTDHPDIDGKEEEFRAFAIKPSRRGVDFPDLISAFLFTKSKETKTPVKPAPMPAPTGGGEPASKNPKPDKISIEDAMILKKQDYKKYVQLLRARKIDTANIKVPGQS